MGAAASALAGSTLLPFPQMRSVGFAWLANAALCAVTLGVLLVRKRWPASSAQAMSLLVISSTMVAQVYSDWSEASAEVHVAAFEGFKIAALVVAIVVPFRESFVFAIIGLCAALPIAVWALMPPALRASLPIEEPWNTVMYPVIATGILIFRLRSFKLEREMIRARAEKEALERFTKVLLAYRDLANSPVQCIELTKSLLHRKHPEADHLTEQLDRSLERLKAIGSILSKSENHVQWTSKEEAFDPTHMIDEYNQARR